MTYSIPWRPPPRSAAPVILDLDELDRLLRSAAMDLGYEIHSSGEVTLEDALRSGEGGYPGSIYEIAPGRP